MRLVLIAALFSLPISAVAAKPLHNLDPAPTHHPTTVKKLHMAVTHPVTGKRLHPITGRKLYPVRRHPVTGRRMYHPVTGKRLHP
jgi:hypothetical protein